jgi:hypothetical protein
MRRAITLRNALLSLGMSVAFFVLVSVLAAATKASALVYAFLLPGSFAARMAGYGGHDIQGLLLYFVGNLAFYWLLAFLLLTVREWIVDPSVPRA